MVTASPGEFSQDFGRLLPVDVKTPLFMPPLSAAPLGSNLLNHALLCPADSSFHIPLQMAIKSGLAGGFCSQMKSWNPLWHFSPVQQQMQNYLNYYFGNSVLNTALMSTQVFFSCRTWVNRVKSRFCWFFGFFSILCQNTLVQSI